MLTARRWLHLTLVVAILLLHLPPRPTYAQDNRPAQVVAALRAFAETLSLLALNPEVQRPLPLSSLSPAHPAGLRLSALFTETVDLLPAAPASLEELKQQFQAIQGSNAGGVNVTLSGVSVEQSATDPDLVDVAFSLDGARNIAVPITVVQPPIVVTGGSYRADLSLATRLRLQVDTRSGALTVLGAPTISIAMHAQSPIADGRGRVGFADVDLLGDVALNAAIAATVSDPDGSGRITPDEWRYTAPEDLFRVAYVDQPGDDVRIVPQVRSLAAGPVPQLLAAPGSSALSLIDGSLSDGILQPVPQLGQLAEFANVTPSQMLSGLQQLTAALGTAHLAGDQKLPFAASRLISTEVLLAPLVNFIRRHGDAAIVCGTEQGAIPPRGDPSNAVVGQEVYCQGVTLKKPKSATWQGLGAAGVDADLTSVGPNPTTVFTVTVPPAGFGAIELSFTDDANEQHVVQPLFRTAGELESRLRAAGFWVDMQPDPTTSTLSYHLVITPTIDPRPLDIDFGDIFTTSVGLSGLRSSKDSLRPQLTVERPQIDITFGVIMLPEGDPRLPTGETSDRFFLKVRSGAGEYEISADATLSGAMPLAGQIGFVEVESAQEQQPLVLDKVDPNKRLLALDITAPAGGIQLTDGRIIPDAIPLAELLTPKLLAPPAGQTSPYVQPALNASLRGEILLRAKGLDLGSGGLQIEWPDVMGSSLTVTPTGDFTPTLGRFADFSRTNPQLLGDVVVGGIDRFLQALTSARGGEISSKLPVLGYSPKELLGLEQIATQLEQVRKQPVRSLQELSTASQGVVHFSLAPSAPGRPNDLVIQLSYGPIAKTTPLRFALSPNGQPALLGGEGTGGATVAYTVTTDLRLGLPLEPASDVATALGKVYVVGGSNAAATATLDTPNDITFAVGARALQLQATGRAHVATTVTLRVVDGDGDGRVGLGELPQQLQVRFAAPTGAQVGDCGEGFTGDVCARLSLAIPTQNSITLGFRIESFTTLTPDPSDSLDDPAGWYFHAPDLDQLITNPSLEFNWNQLAGSLPELLRLLGDALEAGKAVPLVGNDLQAGAKVVDTINNDVVTPLRDLQTRLDGCATIGAVERAIEAILSGQTPGCGRAVAAGPQTQGNAPAGVIAKDAVTVTIFCGSAPCDDALGKDATAITDVRVNAKLEQRLTDTDIPFDLGIEGVPFNITGGLRSDVGWSLPLVFGVSREHGPYIGEANYIPELKLDATLGLKEGAAATPGAPAVAESHPLYGFTPTPVLTGDLGFLTVNLYDRIANRTGLTLGVGVQSSQPIDHLPVERMGELSLDLQRPTGSLSIDLLLRAELLDGDGSEQFAGNLPAVLATIQVSQTDLTALRLPATDKIFDNLYVDVREFKDKFLGPIAQQIDNVTSPIRPVIDTLAAPLPGISDLSRMTGRGNVTLLDMVKLRPEFNGEMIERLAQVTKLIERANCLKSDFIALPEPCAAPQQRSSTVAMQALSNRAGATTSGEVDDGFSFPFLSSPEQAINLLLGKDVTLVRFDAGKLRGEGGFSQTFPPIMVGPIPIAIGISASVAVEGHFAMGYDTFGIRQAFAAKEPVRLLNGLYIDDLDGNGADVPEVAFVGTVAVSAAIDVGIAAAGIRGGIELTLGLDLKDALAPGGKMRFSTIGNNLNNPICLFTAKGRLGAFLSAFVRIGFSFFSKTFDFKIARVTLVDFSKDLCANPPVPNLADVENGNLYLNIGPRAGRRGLPAPNDGDNAEEFVVRQISAENAYPPGAGGGTRVSISAFGIYQERTVPSGGQIIANGGNANDTISLELGVDLQTKQPITFTLQSDLHGGPGDDELKGGDGIDELSGDEGNDTLSGGDGGDTISGNAGDDVIDGGFGDDPQLDGGFGDTLLFGDDNDVITGGPGIDHINGGFGNDRLSGGPGSNQLGGLLQSGGIVTPTAATAGSVPDQGDFIRGGFGNDLIDGGFGDDTLFGNGFGVDTLSNTIIFEQQCADESNVTMVGPLPVTDRDIIQGGFDNDSIFGGSDADHLAGQDGDDRICGNSGIDTIDGDGEGTRGGTPVFSANDQPETTSDEVRWTTDGHDTLFGGSDGDILHGQGGDDALFGQAGSDHLFGDADDDDLSGGADSDELFGGSGQDYLFGDDGSAKHTPRQRATTTTFTFSESLGQPDLIHGDDGDDVLYGEGGGDKMGGDAGFDEMRGNDGDDAMRGGSDDDYMEGNAHNDEMYGDSGLDRMYGNANNDTMRGGMGDDYMEGNQDSDTVYGEANQDDIIGGSSLEQPASLPDARDILFGDADQDWMLGDNGSITRPGGVNSFDDSVIRDVRLLDIDSLDTTRSGSDEMDGGDGNDRMWGQGQGDSMRGGSGDDFIEGNADGDQIWGNIGQDDIIGGSSAPRRLDGADQIAGGDDGDDPAHDHDVILGDNGTITRRVLSSGEWALNAFNDSVVRRERLFDTAQLGQPAPTPGSSGGDTLSGSVGDDRIFGQAGDDRIFGNGGVDYAEGGNDSDTLDGGPGEDDLIGGSASPGFLDGGDLLLGGADDASDGSDVLVGDNGTISRPLACGLWQVNAADGSVDRAITLFEIAVVGQTSTLGGSDTLAGGASNDQLFGQGFDDQLAGASGDDYIEGNDGDDRIVGGAGNDDLVGGTGRVGIDPTTGDQGRRDGADTISGDGGFDTIAGDNAIIVRTLVDAPPAFPCQTLVGGQWQPNSFNGGIAHQPTLLLDRDSAAVAAVSGGDTLAGGDDDDTLFGQGGDDRVDGDAGDDYLEGNAGGDDMLGGVGHDDMLGGSALAGAFDEVRDMLRGGDGADLLLGDNGTIRRPLDDGRWRIDPNTAGPVREAVLFDQQSADRAMDPRFGSGDELLGEGDSDRIYGQSGDDTISGGAGEDSIEGNGGDDTIAGDEGEDDLIGGSSAGDGKIGGSKGPRNLADGNDTLRGGGDDDLLLGDNGRIRRPTDGNDRWRRIVALGFDLAVREVSMESDPERDGAFGNDQLFGDDGHDDLYGQLGDDTLDGGAGDDGLIGDIGRSTANLIGDGRDDPGSLDRVVTASRPPTRATVNRRGILRREVSLFALTAGDGGGADTLLGGTGADTLHGGPKSDLLQGNGDNDRLFGGDGDDALWGGQGDDRLWGGYGNDYLDVKPRGDDPPSWQQVGGSESFAGADILYGGWGQDALQGNQPDSGTTQGDRLLDWESSYNIYYTCPADSTAYGQTTTRSDGTITFLRELARDDGLSGLDDSDSVGTREAAIVATSSDSNANRSPRHPDAPGHAVCN